MPDSSNLVSQEESYTNKIATIKRNLTDMNREMEAFKEGISDITDNSLSIHPKWRKVHTRTTMQYAFMRSTKIQTDCKIKVVSEDQTTQPYVLNVHRLQLIRASAVFEAMLSDDMLEAKTGEITITDLSLIAVRRMMYFIYCDEVNLNSFEEACEVAFAAEKYQIKTLRDISVSIVLKLLAPENVWSALKLANILALKNLKQNCIEMLQMNTLKCITSEEFLQTPEENVIILLKQDELSINDELVLVNATISWARQEAHRRGLSGDDAGVRAVIEPNILRRLRLATISLEQFQTGPGISDWLTQEEKHQIMEQQELENSIDLPKHLSSSKQQRQLTNGIGEYCNRKIHLCKRKVITTLDNLQPIIPVRECDTCTSIFDIEGTEFETKGKCLHALGVFRVKSKCGLLGFECMSRVFNNTDPTLIACKDERPTYEENMQIYVVNKGASLSKSPAQLPLQRIFDIRYTEKTMYNSTISIKFPQILKLVENNWYMIFVIFYSFEENVPVEYPYCTRPKQVAGTSRVKFVFQTNDIPGYWNSINDGFFKTLYVCKN